MPSDAGSQNDFGQTQPRIGTFRQTSAILDQSSDEAVDIGMLLEQAPIEPTDFIVLAIRVVVSQLGAAHFIPHQQHGHAERQQVDGEHVFDLLVTKTFNFGIIGGALDAAIPTEVRIVPIAVFFVIGFVVFFVVGNQVVHGEPVVRRQRN